MCNHRLLPAVVSRVSPQRRSSTPRLSALRSSATSPIPAGAAMEGVAVTVINESTNTSVRVSATTPARIRP